MNLEKDIFLVFDSFVDIRKISLPAYNVSALKVYLFPLTSKSYVIEEVGNRVKQYGYSVQVLPSASIINSKDSDVRVRYIKFVSDFPQKVSFCGKKLKEIFAVEKDLSLWWFSLIAEKNVYKSDSFNCLVQIEAIISEISRREISKIIFSGRSRKLKKVLSEISKKKHIKFKTFLAKHDLSPVERIYEKIPFLIKHVCVMTCKALFLAHRAFKVKKNFVFSSKKRWKNKADASIMIVTPYPNFDEGAAQKGVFKNKYFIHLQEALENTNERIVWISMYVRNKALSFNESLRYAGSFVENGSLFFMLEEFNTLFGCMKAFWKMLASGIKFILLKRRIREASNFGTFNIFSLFEDDWYSSFVGSAGYYGLVSYYTFKNMLKTMNPKKCLYPCEMRAWEKAIIAARNNSENETFLFACQSGTVPRMCLNFFNHPDELNQMDKFSLPQADKIVCNGRLPYEYMKECGWPKEKMEMAEALRYTYLKECLEQDFSSRKKNVVILLLSISAEESSSILSVSYAAFKDMSDVEVWIKPHPFLNLDKVFGLAGVKKEDVDFKVKRGPLKDFLPEALIAVTGESSAAVEALAFGCRVLIVDVPEWINLSPLRFVDTDIVETVSSSEELKQKTVDIFLRWESKSQNKLIKENRDKEKRWIVNKFFYFGQETGVPEKFVELLKE